MDFVFPSWGVQAYIALYFDHNPQAENCCLPRPCLHCSSIERDGASNHDVDSLLEHFYSAAVLVIYSLVVVGHLETNLIFAKFVNISSVVAVIKTNCTCC